MDVTEIVRTNMYKCTVRRYMSGVISFKQCTMSGLY